jgi:hypothetical protein
MERLEFFLFRNYSVAIKTWLSQTVALSRYPNAQNVQVYYMTPEKAYAKYLSPVVNGLTVNPVITFMLMNPQYGVEENSLGFVSDVVTYQSTGIVRYVKPLLVYKLLYQLSIYTILQSDCDVILYQIMSNASKNRKAAVAVDGQWAEIMASDFRNEIALEPGDAQDKLIRMGIDLTVPRAYLPRDYFDYPIITNVSGFTLDENLQIVPSITS